ncbi:Zinc finger, Sec23/Sec24-type [Sesbania bispinosa]|nr:Zinc finger, Sec23/Sec24-type [Sesbania bispinosa]
MAKFVDLETQDGVRMPWNVILGTKQEAINVVVPVAAIYTPIKHFLSMPVLPYSPLRCRTCRSILNPFYIVDFATKIWICPFYFQRNHFPPHYASISDDNLPAELFPQYTTVEYETPGEPAPLVPPVFLFVVDTFVIEEEIGDPKDVSKDQLLEQMSFFAKKPKPVVGVVVGARDGLSSESISRVHHEPKVLGSML